MDWDNLIGYGVVLLWLIGPLLRRWRQQQAPQSPSRPERGRRGPAGAPAPAPATAATPSAARLVAGATEQLGRLESEARQTLERLDPAVRARFGAWLEDELLPRLGDRHERLTALGEAGDPAALGEAIDDAQSALVEDREGLAALRALAERRGVARLAKAHSTADTLLARLYAPIQEYARSRGLTPAAGPPVAVIYSPQHDDRLLASPFGPSLITLPPAVALQPWLWPLLGRELGEHLSYAFPDLRSETYDALALDTGDAVLSPDSEALAKVLFASWSFKLIADLTAVLLFGDAYLELLLRSAGQQADSRAATSFRIDANGSVLPTPPDHVRAHLAAHWLSRMGDESASGFAQRWDEAHGNPQELQFRGPRGIGSIPLEPLLGHLRGLLDRFDGVSLRSLGGSRYAGLPGLSGWVTVARQTRRAAASFSDGVPFAADARALVAAATRASVQSPGSAGAIQDALAASLGDVTRRRRVARPRPSAAASAGPATRFAEALVLADVLLERRRA